jgi:hypothetical protein
MAISEYVLDENVEVSPKAILPQLHSSNVEGSLRSSNPIKWKSYSTPIAWKSYSKRLILASFPNSIPFKQLRHPQYTPNFNLSFPTITLFSKIPWAFPPPTVAMKIPFL